MPSEILKKSASTWKKTQMPKLCFPERKESGIVANDCDTPLKADALGESP